MQHLWELSQEVQLQEIGQVRQVTGKVYINYSIDPMILTCYHCQLIITVLATSN